MELIVQNKEFIKFYLFNGNVDMLHFLCLLMLLDIFTGVMKAIVNHNLFSRKSMYGYSRKMLVFVIIIIANAMDQVMHLEGMLISTTIIFYICNELLSIVENCSQLGLPIPEAIKKHLDVMKEKNISMTTEIKDNMIVSRENETGAEIKIKLEKDGK